MKNTPKLAMDSNVELPEGAMTKVVLGIDPPDNNLITYYVINEYNDYIPVLNENDIPSREDGLIVNFRYKSIKLTGSDNIEKEIIMAEIVEKEEENFNVLLVGIDNYKNNTLTLKGSVNGLKKLEKLMLGEFKYEGEKIKKLLNEKATKASLLFYLNKMVSDAKRGSRLFFYFSGHGHRENNVEGICPFEYDPQNITTIISEDELEGIFKDLKNKGLKLTFICDSCYSGGIMDTDPSDDFMPVFFNSIEPASENIMISACSGARYAHNFPFEDGYCGVLTYYFVESLKDAIDKGDFKKPLSKVIDELHENIKPLRLYQAPVIKGDQPVSVLLSTNVEKEVVSLN